MKRPPKIGDLLASELAHRRESRKSYSLRAFAKHLDVSPSFLSRVLAGSKGLSAERAETIGDRLGWSSERREILVETAKLDRTKSRSTRLNLLERIERLSSSIPSVELRSDIFQAMAKWYHSAILELATLDDVEISVDLIVKRLRISSVEASLGLDRLLRLGLLKREDNRLMPSSPNFATAKVPSQAVRDFHRQMLDAAQISLREHRRESRSITGVTVAVDLDKLPEAFRVIDDFQRSLVALVNNGKKAAVYQLATQFFRLDHE